MDFIDKKTREESCELFLCELNNIQHWLLREINYVLKENPFENKLKITEIENIIIPLLTQLWWEQRIDFQTFSKLLEHATKSKDEKLWRE